MQAKERAAGYARQRAPFSLAPSSRYFFLGRKT
ncbi:MAG: hypothetical protein ACI82F_003396 [Planctomycetota bacterium]|jgi:hypothetical protein